MDMFGAIGFKRSEIIPERRNLPYRNKTIGHWLREKIPGLWPLVLSYALTLLPGLCIQNCAQAESIPGVIPIPKFSENVLKELIKEDSTGINITSLTIGTQFMNVTTRVNSTRINDEFSNSSQASPRS